MQLTWQVCVAVHIVPVDVPDGFTGSQPGNTPPSGPPSGAPPSGTQIVPAASDTVAVATAPTAMATGSDVVPWPMVQPPVFMTSTSKSISPLSPLENPTDSVFAVT